MTWWKRWSTGNYARNWNLTILPNGTCSNQESVLEDETHKILWNFEIQMDHLLPSRRPDLVIINMKEKSGLCHPSWSQSEKQRKWREKQVLEPYRTTGKAVEHEDDGDTTCNWCTWKGGWKSWKLKTIQTTTFLRLVRIFRRILETCGDLLSLRLQWKIIS